jgi:catalase-peroxidase
MKKHNLLMTTAVTVLLSISLSPSIALSETQPKEEAKLNQFWWPELLNLSPLRQNDAESNPLGAKFKYAEEFKSLDLKALKKEEILAKLKKAEFLAGKIMKNEN